MKWQFKKSRHSEKHVFIKKLNVFASASHSAFTWTLQALCTFTRFPCRGTQGQACPPVPTKCLPCRRLQGLTRQGRRPLVLLKEDCWWQGGWQETRPIFSGRELSVACPEALPVLHKCLAVGAASGREGMSTRTASHSLPQRLQDHRRQPVAQGRHSTPHPGTETS